MAMGREIGAAGVRRFLEIHAEFEDHQDQFNEKTQMFMDDMNNRVVRFGAKTFMTPNQMEWLKRIAEELEI